MRILIAYAGKSGTSKKGAELLASMLPNHDVTVADLEKTKRGSGGFGSTGTH